MAICSMLIALGLVTQVPSADAKEGQPKVVPALKIVFSKGGEAEGSCRPSSSS